MLDSLDYRKAAQDLEDAAEETFGDWHEMKRILDRNLWKLNEKEASKLIDLADEIREEYL